MSFFLCVDKAVFMGEVMDEEKESELNTSKKCGYWILLEGKEPGILYNLILYRTEIKSHARENSP